ncbi:MAG: hypothetical protein V4858_27050 [Pseudomonadota bacterium]
MKPAWTPKQGKALPLLASGMTGAATALAVGCKASTVSDWLNNNPAFVAELERLRGEVTRQALAQLSATFSMAVAEVQKVLTTSKMDSVKLKAAMFIIEGAAPKKAILNKRSGQDNGHRGPMSPEPTVPSPKVVQLAINLRAACLKYRDPSGLF